MHPEGTGDELYYFFGPVVENKSFVPSAMEILDIPEAEYAVFQIHKGSDFSALHENVKRHGALFSTTGLTTADTFLITPNLILSIIWGKKPISMSPSKSSDFKSTT